MTVNTPLLQRELLLLTAVFSATGVIGLLWFYMVPSNLVALLLVPFLPASISPFRLYLSNR